jgi:hypothetical protein
MSLKLMRAIFLHEMISIVDEVLDLSRIGSCHFQRRLACHKATLGDLPLLPLSFGLPYLP